MTKLADIVRVNNGHQGDRGDLFKLKKRLADPQRNLSSSRKPLPNTLSDLHSAGIFDKKEQK